MLSTQWSVSRHPTFSPSAVRGKTACRYRQHGSCLSAEHQPHRRLSRRERDRRAGDSVRTADAVGRVETSAGEEPATGTDGHALVSGAPGRRFRQRRSASASPDANRAAIHVNEVRVGVFADTAGGTGNRGLRDLRHASVRKTNVRRLARHVKRVSRNRP